LPRSEAHSIAGADYLLGDIKETTVQVEYWVNVEGVLMPSTLGKSISRLFSQRDPLAKHRAVTGIGARIRWWQRVASLIGVVIIVGVLGLLLAASVGVIVIGGRVLLDVLVS